AGWRPHSLHSRAVAAGIGDMTVVIGKANDMVITVKLPPRNEAVFPACGSAQSCKVVLLREL
ncbi:hypothetical protein ABRQ07_18085, partial [Pectobacterium polonicum]